MLWTCLRARASATLILLAAIGACDAPQNEEIGTEQTQVAPVQVSASELAQAYEDNEAAAQQKYGNRPLLVTGTVTAITLDVTDDPVVQMAGINEFLPVSLNLADEAKPLAATLKKGQVLTFRCESVSEVISAPILDSCTLGEPNGDQSAGNYPGAAETTDTGNLQETPGAEPDTEASQEGVDAAEQAVLDAQEAILAAEEAANQR